MNKKELIAAISAKCPQISKKDIGTMVKVFPDVITGALQEGDTVTMIGFGTFKTTERAARTGRNPASKELMHIPAGRTPKFIAGTAFKKAVRAIK